jgi:hypothetical protein
MKKKKTGYQCLIFLVGKAGGRRVGDWRTMEDTRRDEGWGLEEQSW